MTNHVTGKEQCPQCKALGKDRNADNLARYSDGGAYCFSCGYVEYSNSIKRLLQKNDTEIHIDKPQVTLPSDVSFTIPYEAIQWLKKYDLSSLDIYNNKCMWSETQKRLIFPYFNDTELLAWQGRYLGTEETSYQGSKKVAKWYGKGDIHEFIHPINVTQGCAVLVEDIISAIKVSKIMGSIPIFGSHISAKFLLRLKRLCDTIFIWLDKDKQKDAVKFSQLAQLHGFKSTVIITEKDPKELPYTEIKKLLDKE